MILLSQGLQLDAINHRTIRSASPVLQAIRAKKDQWMTTRSSSTEDNISTENSHLSPTKKMTSPATQNGERSPPSKGFKESLRFFQNQVDCPPVSNSSFSRRKQLITNHVDSDIKPKISTSRSTGNVPSVDNILNNVKTLCAAQNGSSTIRGSSYGLREEKVQAMVFPTVHKPTKHNEVRVVYNSDSETQRTQTDSSFKTVPYLERGVDNKNYSKSYAVPSKDSSHEKPNHSHFLNQPNRPVISISKTNSCSSIKPNTNSALQNSMHSVYEASNGIDRSLTTTTTASSDNLPRTVTDSSFKKVPKISGKQGLWPETEESSLTSFLDDERPPTIFLPADTKRHTSKTVTTDNRSALKSSEEINQSQRGFTVDSVSSTNRTLVSDSTQHHARTVSPSSSRDGNTTESKLISVVSQDGTSANNGCPDEESERRYDSFESDYDSKDFVVHKTMFSEDFLEAMSEDAYSSMNDDYEVEHPVDNPSHPDIPSPDYVSDEEDEGEYEIHRGGSSSQCSEDDDEEDFVDNSAHYVNDPRRYVYYQDDSKELEVIPEEDEDDIEDEDYSRNDCYSQATSSQLDSDHDRDDLCSASASNDESSQQLTSHHQQAECDSGVTDDQRSTSTTAEDCDLEEDDTDSAKGGSLLQPDSSSESPTQPERRTSPVSGETISNSLYDMKSTRKNLPKTSSLDVGSKKIAVVAPDFSNRRITGRSTEDIKNIWNAADTGDDKLQPRSSTGSWDPTELLKELYRLDFPNETKNNTKYGYINKEGYLEKLPSGRKKATYWNPWKRRYFRLQDGFLYCYDSQLAEKSNLTLQLMGGNIDTLENNMIGIDDKKGHYVVVRCSSMEEAEQWEKALLTHCSEDFTSAYIQPVQYPLSPCKDIIIIDFGSCSTRAGILMGSPTLPQLFFPTVCSEDKMNGRKIFGIEALKPELRKNSLISFPVLPSAKVTKYTMDVVALPELFKKIFSELNVDPLKYKVQVSIPRSFSLQTQIKVAKVLLEEFGVKAINLTHQAILSLYAYNASSGIVVDIGDRMDILPINDGYIVEGGVTRLPYGGQRIVHHLKHALAQKHVSLVSDVESYLARHVLEQLCYVAEDYKEEVQRFHLDPDSLEMSISTSHLFQDECPWEEIILDSGRFQVPEGLFTPELWGLDNPGIHKLVHRAIQECSLDVRKEMTRSIYVSGGVTLLPGFVERLEMELDRLTPAKVTPKVHASPYRYHMSYLGACQLASSDGFDEVCVTKAEWRKHGNACLQKWHI